MRRCGTDTLWKEQHGLHPPEHTVWFLRNGRLYLGESFSERVLRGTQVRLHPSSSRCPPKAFLENKLHFTRVSTRGHHTPKKSDLIARGCIGLRAFWGHSKAEGRPPLPTPLTSSLLDLLQPLERVTLSCAHRKLWELEWHVGEPQGGVQDPVKSLGL